MFLGNVRLSTDALFVIVNTWSHASASTPTRVFTMIIPRLLRPVMSACVFCACLQAASARADFWTQTANYPLTETPLTNNTTLSFLQFTPSLGTLTSVDFQLVGHMDATIQFENLSANPATITTLDTLTLSIAQPNSPSTNLLTSTPNISTSTNVSAYDGTLDFSGSSGRTFHLTQDMTVQSTITPPALGSFYVGTGSYAFPIAAFANTSYTGPGNLAIGFRTSASAAVTVTYNYTPAVPEPASIVILSIGGVSLFLASHRGRGRRPSTSAAA